MAENKPTVIVRRVKKAGHAAHPGAENAADRHDQREAGSTHGAPQRLDQQNGAVAAGNPYPRTGRGIGGGGGSG